MLHPRCALLTVHAQRGPPVIQVVLQVLLDLPQQGERGPARAPGSAGGGSHRQHHDRMPVDERCGRRAARQKHVTRESLACASRETGFSHETLKSQVAGSKQQADQLKPGLQRPSRCRSRALA